ncbi:MAG: hypothetical protein ACK417_12765 [Bacteroidia bacterium]
MLSFSIFIGSLTTNAQPANSNPPEISIRWGELQTNSATVPQYLLKPEVQLVNAPKDSYIYAFDIWLVHKGDTIKRYWEEASIDTVLVSNPITLATETRIIATTAGFRSATIEGPELYDYVLEAVEKLVAGDSILIQNLRFRNPSGSNRLFPGPYIFYITSPEHFRR